MKKCLATLMAVVVCFAMMAVCPMGVRVAVAETASDGEVVAGAEAVPTEKIVRNCDTIHETLVTLQHNDSRARVYLGRYYEIMLSDFIMPLNVWLVEHNKSNAVLVENQNSFASKRSAFVADYISYQKSLEELVTIDCKTEPVRFYDKLVEVRKARAVVASDTTKLRMLMDEQVKLVGELKGTL